jgi:hypothetical protein
VNETAYLSQEYGKSRITKLRSFQYHPSRQTSCNRILVRFLLIGSPRRAKISVSCPHPIKEVMGSIGLVYGWRNYDSTGQEPPAASMAQQEITAIPADVIATSAGRYSVGPNETIELFEEAGHLFMNESDEGKAEIFATPGGRFICPPLTFSEFGSPWLQFVQDDIGRITQILPGDDGTSVLNRIN